MAAATAAAKGKRKQSVSKDADANSETAAVQPVRRSRRVAEKQDTAAAATAATTMATEDADAAAPPSPKRRRKTTTTTKNNGTASKNNGTAHGPESVQEEKMDMEQEEEEGIVRLPTGAALTTALRSRFSTGHIKQWFNRLAKDSADHTISSAAVPKLCAELGLSDEGVEILVLLWKLTTSNNELLGNTTNDKFGHVDEHTFVAFMTRINCDNNAKLAHQHLPKMISEVIGDEHKRREFIKWIFLFIRSVTAEASGQKYIDAETALDLWTALESFCQQYKLTKKLYPHLDGFRQFIDVKSGSIRTINLDQWMMFLDFNKNILIDCSNYGDDSALPAMFDEYVQWCRDNGINGASHSLKPAPIAQEEMYNFDRMDEY